VAPDSSNEPPEEKAAMAASVGDWVGDANVLGASPQRDRVGRIEEAGVDYIPEAARDSRPANLATVFFGGNLAFSVIVFGWLPITFGLSWWSAVSASAAGLVIGTLVTAPLALMGPRTGTNNTVSSGAHFGVQGRLVGSGLTLAFALAYAAIAVWTSGDALVGAAHRLIGTPTGNGALAVGYALIAVEIATVALYGHGTVVALQKIVVPVVGVLLLLGIPAFAGGFDAGHAGGDYVLGGFWSTWMLSVTVAAAGPLSYAPTLGDYSRRISSRHGDRRVLLAAGAGVSLGLFATTLFGAFTAVTFTNPSDSYVADLVAGAPGWYVLPILVIGLAGGVGQGVLNLYASGLDLEALIPKLRRVHTTLITSIAAVILLYVGTFALDAVNSITAMTLVLNGLAAPWVVVNLVGFYIARRKRYDPDDLQVFNRGRRGGRYWFTGGWNLRAVLAWTAGSAFGLLAVQTELYTGPLANLAGGVDLSLIGSGLIAGLVYVLALVVAPEGDLA
jgi:purine-cytosine permease-like protein